MFRVYADSNEVRVYKLDILYLKATRKNNWKFFIAFFKDSETLLRVSVNHILFKTFISIQQHSLTPTLKIFWKNGMVLTTDSLKLTIKRQWFKNPIFTVYDSENIVGKVSTNLGMTVGTSVYDVELNCKDEDEIYCLIEIILSLPTPIY